MNRVMFGSVAGGGWVVGSCRIKWGTTDPRLAMTLPYRVQQITVRFPPTRDLAIASFSIIALEMPIALIGYTALSVDSTMTFLTPAERAALRTFSAPSSFVR